MSAEPIMKAQAELEAAKLVTSRRRKGLHDPDVKPLVRNTPNATFYQYGYLREADTLCFWERELAQVRRLRSRAACSDRCAKKGTGYFFAQLARSTARKHTLRRKVACPHFSRRCACAGGSAWPRRTR